VCNTGLRPDCSAGQGANYRVVADLSARPPALQAVDSQSQSGHPGSPHYGDQFPTWLRGEHHTLPLDRAEASRLAVSTLALEPL
jgi:penicillin amidase